MIFTPYDKYEMAVAVAAIAYLHYEGCGPLSNIIAKIKTIDDPYYMKKLQPTTYGALVAMGKERAIAA